MVVWTQQRYESRPYHLQRFHSRRTIRIVRHIRRRHGTGVVRIPTFGVSFANGPLTPLGWDRRHHAHHFVGMVIIHTLTWEAGPMGDL